MTGYCVGVYIAGPMRGKVGFNFAAFQKADVTVRRHHLWFARKGTAFDPLEQFEVFNPAWADIERHDLETLATEEGWEAAGLHLAGDGAEDFDLRSALAEDMEFIARKADHIVLLPGWEGSAGVKAEKALSEALGHTIWYLHPETDLLSLEDPASTPPAKVVADLLDPAYHESMRRHLTPLTAEAAEARAVMVKDEVAPGLPTYRALGLSCLPNGQVAERASGETRTTSATGGQKGVKLARFDLIPRFPLRMLAEHYGRGAVKYADHQWRVGYEFSKSIAAHDRHESLWLEGEEYDVCTDHEDECSHVDADGNPYTAPVSEHGPTCFNHLGSHHLDAMNWHGFFLREMTKYHPEFDDRFKYPAPESERTNADDIVDLVDSYQSYIREVDFE